MVGVFSIYHVYCAAGNSTTIEGWEKDRVATMVRRGKIREVKYPYVSGHFVRLPCVWTGLLLNYNVGAQDLGLIANMKSVLGPNPLFWLWPQSARSDGLSYPVSKAADGKFGQEENADWQDVVGRGAEDVPEWQRGGKSFARQEREALLRSREGMEEV
jgi:hypothetical protein